VSEAFRCLACEGGVADPVYLGCRDYYLAKPVTADYHRCRTCGLLQQSPLPADLASLYEDYPSHARKSALYERARRLVMSPVYCKTNALPRGTALLDYGCGDGAYLAAQRGRGLVLLGYENAPQAARLAEDLGVPVYSDRTRMLEERGHSIDVVTMHFVLEHVTDLHGTFLDAHRLLKPDGHFYFVVPQPTSFEARLFGRRWHGLDPPRHISFPEASVVARLADRHGFALADRRAVPFPNGFAASLPVVLTGRFRFPLFALFLPLGIAFSRLVPTGAAAYELVRL
jgi:SAM-dependent methyltransferase